MAGLNLHGRCLFADLVQPEWAQKPDGTAIDKSFYVLPPDKGNMVAKFASIKLQQPVPVRRFLLAHTVEQGR
jgi:hypothetical protein